jgi:signal peptidase I
MAPSPIPQRGRSFSFLWISAAVGAALVLALVLISSGVVLRSYLLPTSSMEPTLLVGDHLMVRAAEIKRGDIIVFKFPPKPTVKYVKRVIGLPGDHIRIENKIVILNGHKLSDEPYTQHVDPGVVQYRDNFPATPVNLFLYADIVADMLDHHVDRKTGELIVPPGSYFVLGDNRDNSLDSRYWGFVPQAGVIGRPYEVIFSHQMVEGAATSLMGDLAMHFKSKIRWERSLMPIARIEIQ